MNDQPVQKGNPHQLVVRQHIFPKRSIERYCDKSGTVAILRFPDLKQLRVKPKNPVFCVERLWDERAEKGYGKQIEDEYQAVVERVLQGTNTDPVYDAQILTEFYCLWHIRHHWSKFKIEDKDLGGTSERLLTTDDQERLEKAHIVYPTNSGKLPSRILRGLCMQSNLDAVVKKMAGIEWGILSTSEEEFLVPDNFSEIEIIPVSPKLCFAAGYKSQEIGKISVSHINSLAVASAKKYVFARDFDKCPIREIPQHLENIVFTHHTDTYFYLMVK
jgi:hypothetical protein